MEFFKELLEIQHELTIQEVSHLLSSDVEEQILFSDKYMKQNYATFKITRVTPSYKALLGRVQVNEILSTSVCVPTTDNLL